MIQGRQSPPQRLLLAAVLLLALGLRAWGIGFGLPGAYRPDEEHIAPAALAFHQGDWNPHFFYYPSFYFYVLSIVFAVIESVGEPLGWFGPRDFHAFVAARNLAPLYWIARWVTCVVGVATVYAVYRLGRQRFGEAVGLAAAFLLAVDFIHGRDSKFAVTDVPLGLLLTLAFLALPKLVLRGHWRDYALFGAIAGVGASTKYTAVMLGVPFAVMHGYACIERKRLASLPDLLGKPLVTLACMVLGMFAAAPYLFLDWATASAAIVEQASFLSTGWHDFGIEFGWPWVLEKLIGWGIGTIVALFAALGAIAVLIRPSERFRQPVASLDLIAFSLAYLVTTSTSGYLFIRYAIPLTPAFSVLAAAAIVGLSERCARPKLRFAVAALLLVLSGYEPARRLIWTNVILQRQDTREQLRSWISAHVPERTRIGTPNWWPTSRPHGLPNSIRYVPFEQITDRFQYGNGAGLRDWVLVEEHPRDYYVPRLPASTRRFLEEHGRLAVRFDPFVEGGASRAFFDPADAFWVPIDGFEWVERAGPILSLYEVERPNPAALQARLALRDRGHGLRGVYLRGIAWGGPAARPADVFVPSEASERRKLFERIDPAVAFWWPDDSAELPAQFSVEWTGFLEIETSGNHMLVSESDDGSALYVDGALIAQNWGQHPVTRAGAQIFLTKGRHAIALRYFNSNASGSVRLLWQQPDGSFVPIPPESLRASEPAVERPPRGDWSSANEAERQRGAGR